LATIVPCTEYKIVLMTFSCVLVLAMSPAYFHSVCRPVASAKGCAVLSSANYGELTELHKGEMLQSMKFPCCCTNDLEQTAKTLAYRCY